MRLQYIVLLFLFVFKTTSAQVVDIPDSLFLNALINFGVDTNSDGQIQVSEAEATLNLNVSFWDIESVEGIESFVNLVELNISYNEISEIDISMLTNLEIFEACSNNFSEINVSQNLALTRLILCQNSISNLDVSLLQDLIFLSAGPNHLTELDVTNNINLEWLYLTLNDLTSIDISQNPNLTRLHLGQNSLESIDVSLNPLLETLALGYNQITNLDVSNQSNLTGLFVQENNLEYLNIKSGGNILLEDMMAYDNPNLYCIMVDDIEFANSIFCDQPNYWGWCKDDWTTYKDFCALGVEEYSEINFTIYPNPVRNYLQVDSQLQFETIKVFNLQGQLVIETVLNNINVSHLNSGLYFVQVIVDGKSVTRKLIKE